VKNSKSIIPIVFIALALLAALYLSQQTTFFSPKATTSYQKYDLNDQVPAVNNLSDLDNQIRELNRINIDQLDQAIDENATDLNNL